MKKRQTFFVLLVPLVWGTCSLVHFHFPGDEYGMYFISSAVGSWIALVVNFSGDINNPLVRISVALIGMAIMAGLGFMMDRIRVSKILWGLLFVLGGLVVFVLLIKSYPSIEKALSKNGSWWAYILSAINIGLYISVILSVILTVVVRGWKKVQGTT